MSFFLPNLSPALEALLLCAAVSLDAFAASFAYGAGRIRVPLSSAGILSVLCSLLLAVSLLAGNILRPLLPEPFTRAVCFSILFILGILKLFDSSVKALIRRTGGIHKDIRFSVSRVRFILNVYADPEEADRDLSRTLSPAEAASLAVALSLDGLAAGFGAGLVSVSLPLTLILSLFMGLFAVIFGGWLGNRTAETVDLSWLGGVLLILLALLRL